MKINRTLLGLALFLVLLSGCGKRKPYYGFVFMNRSGLNAEDCVFTWGSETISFSYLGTNGSSIFYPYHSKVPEKAQFSWTTEKGDFHEVEVDVPQLSQKKLMDVEFTFVLFPDNTVKIAAFSKQEYYDENKDIDLARNGGPAYAVNTKNASGKALESLQIFFGEYQDRHRFSDVIPGMRLFSLLLSLLGN